VQADFAGFFHPVLVKIKNYPVNTGAKYNRKTPVFSKQKTGFGKNR
jgi:hypothetical protein